VLKLHAIDEQLLASPQYADHPVWRDRAERALMAADKLTFERLGEAANITLWETFWSVVPDAWMEANTWAALAARNQAILAFLQALPAGQPPHVPALQIVYFAAAPDPAPQLRPQPQEVLS
jgi:hypothetical protein